MRMTISERNLVITIHLGEAEKRHQEPDKDVEAFDKWFRDQSRMIMETTGQEDL